MSEALPPHPLLSLGGGLTKNPLLSYCWSRLPVPLQQVGWEVLPNYCLVLVGISRRFFPLPLPFSLGEVKALESKYLKNERAGLLEQ